MIRKLIASLMAFAVLSGGLILATPGAAKQAAPTARVKVGDFFFHPTKVKIKHGGQVKWQWIGMFEHNVTAMGVPEGAKKFHSRTQTSGIYTHLFTTKGTYHLECTIHHFTMTITVS